MSAKIEDIVNFLQISDRLATAGQPTMEQYSVIAATGYQVVINLALIDSPNALVDEGSIASNLAHSPHFGKVASKKPNFASRQSVSYDP